MEKLITMNGQAKITDKQLTPMQELIDYLENNSLIDKKYLINKCKKLKQKEKQVIEDSFINGLNDDVSFEDYYNNKFKKD